MAVRPEQLGCPFSLAISMRDLRILVSIRGVDIGGWIA
jgi:hypothetical protein